jgi:hypothetical protein
MKTSKIIVVVAVALLLTACGSSSGTSSDEGRLITGTIDGAAASLSKAESADSSCLGEVCAVRAYGSDGGQVEGEVDPAQNRWRIRVRAGNWMFGFLDGDGNRLGYLAMNGILAVTVEDGDDVDLGGMGLMDGEMVMHGDAEGLGADGIRSYRGRFGDRDFDGVPAEFDDDEDELSYDPAAFDAILIRPYDGQLHVAPCRPIKIAFSQAIDDATVTAESVVVTLADGTPVDGTFEIWEGYEVEGDEDEEYEVKFLPAGGYPMGSEVILTVLSGPDGVLSETGEELPADISTSFTVRDFGGTSLTCHDPDDEHRQEMLREREREREREMQGQAEEEDE